MPEVYSYKVLQKKIAKVNEVLQKLKIKDKADTKEYRAYERKRDAYQARLEKTSEFKEQKLQNALKDIQSIRRSSTHSIGTLSADISSNDDNSSSSSSGSSSSSSTSSSSSEESIDYEVVLKKFDKATRLMQDLEEEHGDMEKAASATPDYQRYANKKAEYLRLLERTEQWKEESYRRMEEEAIRKARAEAQAEQDREVAEQQAAVQKAREEQKAELEKQKEAALAKLRADRAKKEQLENQKREAYEKAERLASQALKEKAEALEKETKKREEDYRELLKAQEERGMIRMVGPDED